MNKFISILLLFMLALSFFTKAQNTDQRCATSEAQKILLLRQPGYAKKMQALELEARQLAATKANLRTVRQSDTIPVVFHVLYRNQQENISDAQLLSQLTVLNEDFNRKNADAANTPSIFQPSAANAQLYFCLATLDPNGDPTTGITRTQTNQTAFRYTENAMKSSSRNGIDPWNPDLYLNIWICNLADNILGYAQFPGGPQETDGIVLKYTSVGRAPFNPYPGPYNLGRTATHEVGHWLGLRHIWGEEENTCSDSDLIEDTPNQMDKSSGCPSFPQFSCNNGPGGNMFMNYMDYTNDGCMNLFTNGQSDKMIAILQTGRRSILTSNVCSNKINADFRAIPDAVNPNMYTNFYYYSNGRRPKSFFWTFQGGFPETSSEQNPQHIRYDQAGAYTVTLTVTDENGFDTETKIGYLKVTTNKLQLYPNPANEEVQVGAPAGQKLRKVAIYNAIGKLFYEDTLNERTLNVAVAEFPNGIYLVQGLTDTGKTLSEQLIIMHGRAL